MNILHLQQQDILASFIIQIYCSLYIIQSAMYYSSNAGLTTGALSST